MTSYARRMSHPPIFGDLTLKADPYGPVAQLARRLAVTQPNDPGKRDKLKDEIDRLLKAGKYREPDYNPWAVEPEDVWGAPEGYYE